MPDYEQSKEPTTNELKPNEKHSDALALFASLDQIHVCAIHPDRGEIFGSNFGTDADAAIEFCKVKNADGFGIYWTVNRVRSDFTGNKPSKPDITNARFLHVDLDPPKEGGAFDKQHISDFLMDGECPPSFIIDSGNGIQAFWRLDGPHQNLEAIEGINRQLAHHYQADHCHNIDRLMRVPNFTNHPNAKKREAGRTAAMAGVIVSDTGQEYEAAEIGGTLPDAPSKASLSSDGIATSLDGETLNIELLTPEEIGITSDHWAYEGIMRPKGEDRSSDGFKTCGELVRAGKTDEQIAGIILNRDNPVSAYYLKGSNGEAVRWMRRDIGKVRADHNAENEAGSRNALAVLENAKPTSDDYPQIAIELAKIDTSKLCCTLHGVAANLSYAAAYGDYPAGIWIEWLAAHTLSLGVDPSEVSELIKSGMDYGWSEYRKDFEPPVTIPEGLPAWRRDIGDGALAQFVDHCDRTGTSPQPYVSLGSGLACFGALAGRRYRSPTNLRTNIYSIGICDSGGGKDNPLRQATNLMIEADQKDQVFSGKLASGQGLITAVKTSPSIMLALDEIGFLIRAASGKNAQKYIVEILDNLTQLYSMAGHTFMGVQYADANEKPRDIIEQPCVTMVGVTTPKVFWDHLSGQQVQDGSLARMVIFESENDYPDANHDADSFAQFKAQLVNQAKLIAAGVGEPFALGLGPNFAPNIHTVQYANTQAKAFAREMRDEQTAMLRQHQGTNLTSVIARLAENAVKIALIHAITENPTNPHITKANLDWGMMIAAKSVDSLKKAVSEQIGDNDIETGKKRILKIITDAGFSGIRKSEITNKTKNLVAPSRNAYLADLVEAGSVTETAAVGGKGPKTSIYCAK